VQFASFVAEMGNCNLLNLYCYHGNYFHGDFRRDLEQARRKLRSSNRRVAQLEKWLDEIYNDKNFEIVVKGAAFRGRKTTLSLPDIQGGSGEMTARKGLGRKSFKPAEPVTAKSTRSSFNF